MYRCASIGWPLTSGSTGNWISRGIRSVCEPRRVAVVSDASVFARLRNIGALELVVGNGPLAMGDVGDGNDWAGFDDDPCDPSELFDSVRDDIGTIRCWAFLAASESIILGFCCCL